MTEPLFLLDDLTDPLPMVGAHLTLAGDDGRHAAVVRRIQTGETIMIGNGRGLGVRGVVVDVGGSSLIVEVVNHLTSATEPRRFVAAQALAKGDRSELAVEMMTEIGVDEIVPWQASRSIVRWSPDRTARALAKWRSTAREAAKQSRRLNVPQVSDPVTTRQLAHRIASADLALMLHEEAKESLTEVNLPTAGTVLIIIGPEGGISAEERDQLTEAGARSVSISDAVLRTSTAGVVALAGLKLRREPSVASESFVTDAQSSEVRPEPLALRPQLHEGSFGFAPNASVPEGLGRSGVITTPHGIIRTPAFVAVGTKATVKAVLPESMAALGVQALLANAYHLYLQPGPDVIEAAGGLGRFMNWSGPTFTDSGGFQVMSLGAGFKKVLAMNTEGLEDDDVIAAGKTRLAHVDENGVTFTSHLDGSQHRFTPELSMRIQHQLGADVIFAFDECTTLMNTRDYQERSVARTQRWAARCFTEHQRLTVEHAARPYQALFAVVQGAQYEDLRREAARDLVSLTVAGSGFDGYGIGGALEKDNLGTIVRWVCEELPEDKPRHLLGISEPNDIFIAIENGVDTFDCVSPSRVARNAAVYTVRGRFNVNAATCRRSFSPIDEDCDCYTCAHYTRAYLHHLFKAREMLASTLCTIHNERFIVRLVDDIRLSIEAGTFADFKIDFLHRYYGSLSRL